MYIWEVAAFPSWESCHLGKCTFGKLPLFLHGEVATIEKLSFGKLYIWKVDAWEITHLGSCNLGKHPWEVAAWENAFGKESSNLTSLFTLYNCCLMFIELV